MQRIRNLVDGHEKCFYELKDEISRLRRELIARKIAHGKALKAVAEANLALSQMLKNEVHLDLAKEE